MYNIYQCKRVGNEILLNIKFIKKFIWNGRNFNDFAEFRISVHQIFIHQRIHRRAIIVYLIYISNTTTTSVEITLERRKNKKRGFSWNINVYIRIRRQARFNVFPKRGKSFSLLDCVNKILEEFFSIFFFTRICMYKFIQSQIQATNSSSSSFIFHFYIHENCRNFFFQIKIFLTSKCSLHHSTKKYRNDCGRVERKEKKKIENRLEHDVI